MKEQARGRGGGKVALSHHGNTSPAHRALLHITQPCTQPELAPDSVARRERCLVIGQLEAGAWNVFTLLND